MIITAYSLQIQGNSSSTDTLLPKGFPLDRNRLVSFSNQNQREVICIVAPLVASSDLSAPLRCYYYTFATVRDQARFHWIRNATTFSIASDVLSTPPRPLTTQFIHHPLVILFTLRRPCGGVSVHH